MKITALKGKAILSGNEAIARGALEAGVSIAASYPGTPATEILETLASVSAERHIHAEWSTNEKVAFEVATAGAICGLRSIVSMKQPGVNWIVDPLMVVNLSGVKGGLVIVACDDPGCHSSANEQDSRFYGQFAETVVLELADPQEAKDMTKAAFEISEKIELPVFVRSVTRVSHSRGDVSLEELPQLRTSEAAFQRDPNRFWISGAKGLKRHSWLHKQQGKIREVVDDLPFNRVEQGSQNNNLCIATSGVAYNYVKEALKLMGIGKQIAVLKIGVPYPLPEKLVKQTLPRYKKVLVVEEGEPFLESNLKVISAEMNARLEIFGKGTGYLEPSGELNTETVKTALAKFAEVSLPYSSEKDAIRERAEAILPERTMTFCVGCPHRSTLFALKEAMKKTTPKPMVVGDIGCYALSILPPYQTGDVKYSMGASVGVASGLSHVLREPIVAMVGDSTFFHASIPALVNATYNESNITVIVLDNMITGMTGGQPHPGIGITATGKKTKKILIEDVARSCGADHVEVVDSFDTKKLQKLIEDRISKKGVSVIVSRGACALRPSTDKDFVSSRLEVNDEACTGCLLCMTQFGCPAITRVNKRIRIDETTCTDCGACVSICPHGAIEIVQKRERR